AGSFVARAADWHALRNRPAADHARPRPAVVDVPSGVALASAGQCVPVSFLRPGAFLEEDAVVVHDRALADMEIGDRLVVFDDGRPERLLGDGSAALSFEHVIKRRATELIQSIAGIDVALRGGPAVGVGLSKLEIRFEIAKRVSQAVRDVELRVLQESFFASQTELRVGDTGQG